MSWLPRIGLLLATLFFTLLLAEGVARVVVDSRDARRAWARDSEGLPTIKSALTLSEPHVMGRHRGVLYRTNSQGLRGPEYEEGDPPDRFRILVAGDSVTVGWAVEEEEAYPNVLGAMLEENPPRGSAEPHHFETINLGLAGVNAEYASRRLESFGKVYGSDLHIYGFTLNDIYGPNYRSLPKEDDSPDGGSAPLDEAWRRALRFQDSPSVLLRELWPRWVMLLEWELSHQSVEERVDEAAAELHLNYFENPEAWVDFEAALDRIAAAASERGVCAHLLIHTHLTMLGDDHPYGGMYARVRDAARARGLSVTETYPRFAGREEEALWVHKFDVHPNAEGHAVLARALYEGLRELPGHCWDQSAGASSR